MIRQELDYANMSDRFIVPDKTYTQQFAGLYFTRLNLMRPKVLYNAKILWANHKGMMKLLPTLLHTSLFFTYPYVRA